MAKKSISDITVVSFNAYGAPFHPRRIIRTFLRNKVRKRFRIIADFFENDDADVIALQEVFTYPHLFLLKKLLPQYPYVIYQKFIYGPRGGLVLFSKIPLTRYSYIDFEKKGVWWNKSITGPLTRKGVLIAKLTDCPLYILNTHLTQNSDHDWDTTNRYASYLQNQLAQFVGIIRLLRGSMASILVAGDFNLPHDSVYYKEFLEAAKLVDPFKKETFSTYHQSFLPEGEHLGRIDYIFTGSNGNLKVKKTDHIFTDKMLIDGKLQYVSDHVGLKLRLSITQNAYGPQN